jgi:multidrug efflux pump subunit AcrB
MPRGTNLDETIDKVRHVETTALRPVRAGEMRASVAYAGQLFTETEPLFGEHLGQIMVSLNPVEPGGRSVDEIAAAVETELRRIEGAAHLTIFSVKGGPPVQKPINVKVRGDGFDEIKAVADHLQSFLTARPDVSNLTQDYRPGNRELLLRRNGEALQRLGVNPETLSRTLQAYVDGVLVTEFQNEGEEVKVRVRADNEGWSDIDTLLRQGIPAAGGGSVPLGELVTAEYGAGLQSIRHYNFRRAVTLEGDIDKEKIDTVQINELIRAEWDRVRPQFPNVDLDFSGELDDIQESIDSIGVLFLLGVGLIYLILGTQFRSYFQPFMILITVPMAFTGVVLGLLVTRNPLSLFTLYGVVALTGVAVNSAIVMISAANDRLRDGMGLLHAAIYSARRRVIPILITSLTTIAGLFSLAAGLGGKSLVWGPVATAIVWGLAFSTVMTLFVIPLLYAVFMARRPVRRTA